MRFVLDRVVAVRALDQRRDSLRSSTPHRHEGETQIVGGSLECLIDRHGRDSADRQATESTKGR